MMKEVRVLTQEVAENDVRLFQGGVMRPLEESCPFNGAKEQLLSIRSGWLQADYRRKRSFQRGKDLLAFSIEGTRANKQGIHTSNAFSIVRSAVAIATRSMSRP